MAIILSITFVLQRLHHSDRAKVPNPHLILTQNIITGTLILLNRISMILFLLIPPGLRRNSGGDLRLHLMLLSVHWLSRKACRFTARWCIGKKSTEKKICGAGFLI